MSNSVQPQRQQPTRLLLAWDSPGKNTGVGCHILLKCMKVKSESEVAQSCSTLSDPMDCSPPGSSIHGIFQARVLEWGAIAFSDNNAYLSHYCEDYKCKAPNKPKKGSNRYLVQCRLDYYFITLKQRCTNYKSIILKLK